MTLSQADSVWMPTMTLPLTKDVGVLLTSRSFPSWRPASTRGCEALESIQVASLTASTPACSPRLRRRSRRLEALMEV